MAIIKKFSPFLGLDDFSVFIDDTERDSIYFNITELDSTLTGGKNAFLFEGSECFAKGSKVRFEALDVEGNTLFIEPGVKFGKTFREGTSIVMAIHVYDDTPIGVGSLTILAELESYFDESGNKIDVPDEFKGRPNIRWTQSFKINPKLPNKTPVRFFKRPTFTVTEIEKPLIIKDDMTLSKSGSIIGIPELPDTGSDFSNWTSPSRYRIKLQEGNNFTQSMDENTTLVVDSLGYSSSVLEVLNEDEMIVRKPYLVDNIVQSFSPVSYSMDFESIEDASVNTGSSIIASYAEIRLENLATFTGDVARIKIFRKSRNDLGDFQVVQENKLDSTELLRDFTVDNRTVINYGKLRKENIVSDVGDVYYTTSSGVKVHNEHLINSLLVSSSHTVESNGTIGEFELVSGSEYSLSYKSRFIGLGDTSQSFADSNTLEFLIVTSSNNTTNTTVTTQSIDIQTGSNQIGPAKGVKFKSGSGEAQFFHTEHDGCGIGNQQNVTKNFFSEINGKCQVRVKANTQVNGVNNFPTGSFVFGTLSLKNAEESSYSPDEYTAIVDIPRKNPTEQFDFRVEFYDINNNFIPIKVEQSVPFRKGNQSRILETAVNVSASGIADAGDVLNVDGSGNVNITSTTIGTSTISTITGLGNPATFSSSVDTQNTTLFAASSSLNVASASLGGSTTALNEETASLLVSASENRVVNPSTGEIIRTSSIPTSGSGLFINNEKLGFVSESVTAALISSSGHFILSGSSGNSLRWNGDELQIKGDLTASTGNIGGFTIGDNQLIGYINAGATRAVQLDSGQSANWQFDGDDVGGFLLTTSGSGDVSQVVNNAWVSEPLQNKFFFRVGGNNQFIKFQQSGSDDTAFLTISSSNFSINQSGSVQISSSILEQVTITQVSGSSTQPVFSVSPAGRMIAKNADIEGDISASGGSIGGFTIGGDRLLGSGSALVIDGGNQPKIQFFDGADKIVSLNSSAQLSPVSMSTAPGLTATGFNNIQSDSHPESDIDFVNNQVSLTQSPSVLAESISTSNLRFPASSTIEPGFAGAVATFSGTLVVQSGGPFVASVGEALNGIIAYMNNTFKIGVRIKDNSGTIKATFEETVNENYLGTSASTHTFNSNTSVSFNNLQLTLESGKSYSFETFIKDGSTLISATTGQNGGGASLTSTFRTPNIGTISVSIPTNASIEPFTEINKGGFQVISDADPSSLKLIKAEASSGGNALSVSGSIEASGNITAFASSDERLKENIIQIPNSLEKIKQIKGVLFNWKEGYDKVHPYGENKDVGVIAQEVQQILPEIVKENVHNQFLGVRYEKLTPLLLEAIKELSKKVEELEKKLKDK